MEKYIEIEVPDGKVGKISKDGDTISIKFEDENILDRVRTIDDAIDIARDLYPKLYVAWNCSKTGSYEEKLYAYRIVVAVLTNNEKNSLTTGKYYYPNVQFCKSCEITDIERDHTIIGHIKSGDCRFTVVAGQAVCISDSGLCNLAYNGISRNYSPSFLAVPSIEVAEHISKHFGRLVFDLMYGESNCDYRWI